MKRTLIFLITTCAVLNIQAESADGISETDIQNEKIFNINGYGRASMYAGSQNFDVAFAFAEVSLQPSIEKWGALLKSDLRFRAGYFFNEFKPELQIKELYVGYNHDKFSVFLGNQIVNWGRTEGFSPTNNITPNDYFFLSANPNDQKLSNFMLKLNYRPISGINLELTGIPFYKMSNYRFDLFDLSSMGDVGEMLGMSGVTPDIIFDDDILPEQKLKNGSLAFRADFDYPAFGGSLSCFHGYDPYHGIEVNNFDLSSGQPVITIVSIPYRKTTVGADFAIPAKMFIIRGEIACNITENNENKTYIPNSDLSYVAGLEANADGFMLLAQYIGKYTFDFRKLTEPVLADPTNQLSIMQFANEMVAYQFGSFNRKIFNQQEEFNHAVSFTVSKSFVYDQLNVELTAYYNFTSEEFMVRPCLSWKINDLLSLTAGGIYMYGKENTLYGFSSKTMNGGFIELKVSF
ncbi:MAG: hypothetical protein LBF01_04485 [Bacteroidales bacterium]|jgi:hypothetical protein|nr:hypothetical protein [Bacteroidales bacterium]